MTRKFAVEVDLDPSIFDDFQIIVNFILDHLQELQALEGLFPPQSFERNGHNAVKETYNTYKQYLKEHKLSLPFNDKYIERVYRCAFQYVYFILQNYHRQRNIVLGVGKVLSSELWWESLDPNNSNNNNTAKKSKTIGTYLDKINGSRYEIVNNFNQYRSLVVNITNNIKIDQSNIKKEQSCDLEFLEETQIQTDFNQFLANYQPKLSDKLYLKLQRSFKQQLGYRINQSYKALIKGQIPGKFAWAEYLVLKILEFEGQNHSLIDTKSNSSSYQWETKKKRWRKDYNKKLASLQPQDLLDQFKCKTPTTTQVIQRIFYPKVIKARLSGGSIRAFQAFIQSYLQNQCLQDFARWMARKYHTSILSLEEEVIKDLSTHYPNLLTFPKFRAKSIPLGMDDGRIYKIDEDNNAIHYLKFIKKTPFQSFSFEKDERYIKLIQADWTPQRGVLRLLPGKKKGTNYSIILCLPFAKKVPNQLEKLLNLNTEDDYLKYCENIDDLDLAKLDGKVRVAGDDLGLKDGGVISIYELSPQLKENQGNNTNDINDINNITNLAKNSQEVARRFVDQKELAGKKNEWFLAPKSRKKVFQKSFPNFKGKLFKLRHFARKFQSERAKFVHPKKHKTRAFYYLRREEKKKWSQISSIHEELINQLATRMVEYCVYHEVEAISLENLKWSSHSLKEKVGRYLAHWQVHWFFSQLQEKIEELAAYQGIFVLQINPRNTSKNCFKCGNKGERNGKLFKCLDKECGWRGDSDLNAARNICLRGIKQYLKYRKKVIKGIFKKLKVTKKKKDKHS